MVSLTQKERETMLILFKDCTNYYNANSISKKLGIRIRFLGRLGMFPEGIRKLMHELMEKTAKNSGLIVNFCMAYGGRQEIVDAAKNIVADVEAGKIRASEISEEMFRKYLYMADEPDMIIRTGGEQRLSGFLLYASSYSELIFLQKTWPEFEKADLAACIEEFKKRERRFGK